jgi:hypothetical protein
MASDGSGTVWDSLFFVFGISMRLKEDSGRDRHSPKYRFVDYVIGVVQRSFAYCSIYWSNKAMHIFANSVLIGSHISKAVSC